jgi:hypothetical protein
MKYWSTVRPSRKFAVMGVSMISPLGLGHEAAHAGELADLLVRAAGARVGHHEDRVERRLVARLPVSGSIIVSFEMPSIISFATLSDDLGPDVDDLVVALAVGDQALLVLLDHLGDLLPGASRMVFLLAGITMLSMQIEMPDSRAYSKPSVRRRSARSTVSLLRWWR